MKRLKWFFHRHKYTINNNAPSPECTDSNDSDNSEPESDSSTRLAFNRSLHDDLSNSNRNASELQKRINDGEAVDKEYEKVISNWIECKPKCKKIYSKKELNWCNNEKLCLYNNSWGLDMKLLIDYMIEEGGSERKFEYLPEMCTKSPVQLGALTSESFQRRCLVTLISWWINIV